MLDTIKGARLGVFIFLGSILLVIGIFLIGNKDLLFKKTFEIKTYFKSVEGLREGSPVRLTGIDVGSVKSIKFSADTAGKILVVMRINSDAKDYIRKDSKASIETEGLVGNKVLLISGGTINYPAVEEGDVIESKDPIGFAEIIAETQGMLSYVKEITRDFSEIVKKVNQGEGTIGMLINDKGLYESVDQTTQSANKTLLGLTENLESVTQVIVQLSGAVKNVVTNVDSVIAKIDEIVLKINKGEGVIGALVSDKSGYDSVKAIINNMIMTAQEAKLGAERFAENMEALKHNWLFKGYFEKRGYWEKAEYEKELELKLQEIKTQQRELEKRIQELRDLEKKVGEVRR